MNIGPFKLENEEKLHRAIYGTVGKGGAMIGGVGEGASEDQILAEYDKLAGLITKNGEKVKTGSFYDFKERKPRETPEVKLVFVVNGQTVEVPDGEELPGIVKAAKILEAAGDAPVEDDDENVTLPKRKGKKAAEDE